MARRDEVLLSLLEEGAESQLQLSQRLGISLSAVNSALKPLEAMGAVEIRRRGLKLLDKRKAALYYATHWNLQDDLVYSTRAEKSVQEIEKSMPSGAIYTAYSGYKFLYGEVPADYSEVYVYADEKILAELKKRFPEKNGRNNLFVLRANAVIERLSRKGVAPEFQLFADLWNLREWYAAEFLKRMEERLFG